MDGPARVSGAQIVSPVLTKGSPDFAELARMSDEAVLRLTAAAEADMEGAIAERDEWLAQVTGPAGVHASIVDACSRARLCFLLSDPNEPGHPITYASPAFLELTGFSVEEARQLNCTQALHGPETDVAALKACARAMHESRPFNVRLRLYGKQRQPFWSQWWLTPLYGPEGTVQNWLGVFFADEDGHGCGAESPPQLWLPREVSAEDIASPAVKSAMQTLRERYGGGAEGAQVLGPITPDFVARTFSTPAAQKRTYEENLARVDACCQWRQERRPWAVTESQVAAQLECGALHWSGFAKDGSPVLYSRPGKIGEVDPPALELAHIWMLERGLRLMRPGVTGFVVVVDTEGLGVHHLSTDLCRRLQPLVTRAYFGRMNACVAGPSSSIASAAWRVIRVLLPSSVASKITYCRSPRKALLAAGLLDEGDLPSFVQ